MTLVGLDGVQISAEAADGIASGRRRRGNGDGLRAQSRFRARHLSQLRRGQAARGTGRAPACSLRRGPATSPGRPRIRRVSTYRLIDYVLDVVPYVPFDAPPAFQYSTLPGAEILLPSTAQAEVRFDVRCNHNLICYCAMLDYADTKRRTSVQDIEAWRCILGPPAFGLNRELTLALATAVNALGPAAEQVAKLISVTARAKGGHV